jgi:NAD(P)-dependent dehydrogenase (short-subunit alcohol dehydrogenase family)
VNLTGAFLCTREAAKLMGGVGGRRHSQSRLFLPFAPRHPYGATKAAIDILSNPKLEARWPITM